MANQTHPTLLWHRLSKALAGDYEVSAVCATFVSQAALYWQMPALLALSDTGQSGLDIWLANPNGKSMHSHWEVQRPEISRLTNDSCLQHAAMKDLLPAAVVSRLDVDFKGGALWTSLPFTELEFLTGPSGFVALIEPQDNGRQPDQSLVTLASWFTVCWERATLWEALLTATHPESKDGRTPSETISKDSVYRFVHELRTPLATILLYTNLMRESKQLDDDKMDRFLTAIENESGHLQELMRDFVDSSRS